MVGFKGILTEHTVTVLILLLNLYYLAIYLAKSAKIPNLLLIMSYVYC